MKIEGDGKRVTVYVGSADTWHGRNLAVAIVERCRELGMAGATVSRGIMGFGKHSVIHKAHLLGLSDDLPEKIEIVDSALGHRPAAAGSRRDDRRRLDRGRRCACRPISARRGCWMRLAAR